ncbi:hypothetical protein SacmaDRAFT_5731 [Saccharomonospora marina XMU15]|uniref:PQQ enzyme repeat-containing protein n=1 Tax=Saccharomonospora marina XMU15 TaxID=882083 RepID=H5XC41_9PSEU|nr:hypothetical protein [Saccharomonospora marina]EHR53845.1 hypothetical protein SacmaDRAFT_5731 [Saccharomonospora marina XMU15]
MFRRRALAALAISLFVVTAACGDSTGGNLGEQVVPRPDSQIAPRLSLPDGFDSTRGWRAGGGSDRLRFGRPVVAPRAGVVLLRATTHSGDASHVVAHDAATGAVRWRGGPVPNPESRIDTLPFVVNPDGREYVVLATTGAEGGDGVDKATDTTHLYVYDVASSGDGVAPLREITVPGEAAGYEVNSDGAILVSHRRGATVVDVATGETTDYESGSEQLAAPKECGQLVGSCNDNSRLVGITGSGPLVQGHKAFWVPGGWFSDDVTPQAASPDEGGVTVEVVGSADGKSFLAAWPVRDGVSGVERVWAVHDGDTGAVVASVTCEQRTDGFGDPMDAEPVLSANGRYLIFDIVGFDLRSGEGRCFAADEQRNEIQLTSVADDGTAYGHAAPSSTSADPGTPASVSLETGEADPLGDDTRVPSLIGAGVGVFDEDGGGEVYVYPTTS